MVINCNSSNRRSGQDRTRKILWHVRSERFTSFEGDTGPYIIYTIVRIKSILAKYQEQGGSLDKVQLAPAVSPDEKALMMEIAKFNTMMETA